MITPRMATGEYSVTGNVLVINSQLRSQLSQNQFVTLDILYCPVRIMHEDASSDHCFKVF